jgi:hypothetical protein
MKSIALALALVSTSALAAGDIVMHRDPGCGCCEKWAIQVRQKFGRAVKIVDDVNRAAIHKRLGMPASLASCHTAIIDGIAFEGHVPIADMKRVLAAKPKGVRGLAVAGMPIGSPGMEAPGYRSDRYNVIAFGSGKTTVFAKH